jgi:hypothetical protein
MSSSKFLLLQLHYASPYFSEIFTRSVVLRRAVHPSLRGHTLIMNCSQRNMAPHGYHKKLEEGTTGYDAPPLALSQAIGSRCWFAFLRKRLCVRAAAGFKPRLNRWTGRDGSPVPISGSPSCWPRFDAAGDRITQHLGRELIAGGELSTKFGERCGHQHCASNHGCSLITKRGLHTIVASTVMTLPIVHVLNL